MTFEGLNLNALRVALRLEFQRRPDHHPALENEVAVIDPVGEPVSIAVLATLDDRGRLDLGRQAGDLGEADIERVRQDAPDEERDSETEPEDQVSNQSPLLEGLIGRRWHVHQCSLSGRPRSGPSVTSG